MSSFSLILAMLLCYSSYAVMLFPKQFSLIFSVCVKLLLSWMQKRCDVSTPIADSWRNTVDYKLLSPFKKIIIIIKNIIFSLEYNWLFALPPPLSIFCMYTHFPVENNTNSELPVCFICACIIFSFFQRLSQALNSYSSGVRETGQKCLLITSW